LAALPPANLSASKNIVLLIVDGLGYEYLLNEGRGSVFCEYLTGQMTSVFPIGHIAFLSALRQSTL
jgi:hypothetical protein